MIPDHSSKSRCLASSSQPVHLAWWPSAAGSVVWRSKGPVSQTTGCLAAHKDPVTWLSNVWTGMEWSGSVMSRITELDALVPLTGYKSLSARTDFFGRFSKPTISQYRRITLHQLQSRPKAFQARSTLGEDTSPDYRLERRKAWMKHAVCASSAWRTEG